MKVLKKYATKLYATIAFLTIGGGGGIAEMVYFGPKREVTEWIREYEASATAEAVVNGRTIYFKWNTMKAPPVDNYTLDIYLGSEYGSPLGNPVDELPIRTKRLASTKVAKDWEDYRRITYDGKAFQLPDHLRPGNYTMIFYYEIPTTYGTYEIYHEPIPFTIE